jgi:hypothetical protein
MHFVIRDRNRVEIVVFESVKFELKCERRLEVAVDDVFAELVPGAVGEVFGELFVTQHDAGDATNLRFTQKVDVVLTVSENVFKLNI